MADDAGFAVALTIREQLLKDALLIAYSSNDFPRKLNTEKLPGGLLPGGHQMRAARASSTSGRPFDSVPCHSAFDKTPYWRQAVSLGDAMAASPQLG